MARMSHRPVPGSYVDTPEEASLSFTRPGPQRAVYHAAQRAPLPVGPGRPSVAVSSGSGPLLDQVSVYPIQIAKVQRPALRDETLERPRLLDWLRAKVHGRVVLLLADAGYGKTTLLADYARRTRMRTLWYRLDPDDRDWVTLLHHLVAAGREHDPGFAPATAGLLTQIGVGGPAREVVLDTFLEELPSIAVNGAVLILDDFHVVDDAPDVRHVTRELLARAPERLTVVFASRRLPPVPLSRMRSVGEVAELGTDDLRFDAAETSQLFTETYGRRLDADVLADLVVRTEGWIASLQLVQAALRDRSPAEIRRFVRSLSGAHHDLYDYLAEEVVGDLSEELQRFLMETSILQVVTPELAEVVCARDATDVARLTLAAERLTLLSRLSGGPRTHLRYHPLVREFLEARFRSTDGHEAVATLHRRTAAAAAASDWRLGAHHYREAGDTDAMLDVIGVAIPTIMGNGQYDLAEAFIGTIAPDQRPPGFELILSRVDMQHGDYEAAIAASQAVLDSGSTDPIQRDHALLNLLSLYFNFGDGERALELAAELESKTIDNNLRSIARVTASILLVKNERDIDAINRRLRTMAHAQRADSSHHFGVSMLNLASNSLVQDRLHDALSEIGEALEALEATTGAVERSAATVLCAGIFIRLGRIEEATDLVTDLSSGATTFIPNEAFADAADAFDSYGSPSMAMALLDRMGDESTQTTADRRAIAATKARMSMRRGDFAKAKDTLATFPDGMSTVVGALAAVRVTGAQLKFARGDAEAVDALRVATMQAASEGAHGTRRVGELLIAAASGAESLSQTIPVVASTAPWHLSFVAEELIPHLPALRGEAHEAVRGAVSRHQDRWRAALRRSLDTPSVRLNVPAARLLEEIGEWEDIARLRSLAKSARKRPEAADLGRGLSRRLAHRVRIEDQGRLGLEIGTRLVVGSSVRRKVLAMLSFLLTRSDMSATRDQVLEALWPELDPDVAINSLNQTIYFLRRVFEENYSDDLTPGYVHHDSGVIWLDAELVSSRSVECWRLIRQFPSRPSPDDVERLSILYRGRFALDFEYEEWASAYRDTLHAAYLEIVEKSVLEDFRSGHFDRGIIVARRALDVDPDAEQVEICLLRLYRVTGAHSAAAEQYAHYAAVMREELGIEPPPLESL